MLLKITRAPYSVCLPRGGHLYILLNLIDIYSQTISEMLWEFEYVLIVTVADFLQHRITDACPCHIFDIMSGHKVDFRLSFFV